MRGRLSCKRTRSAMTWVAALSLAAQLALSGVAEAAGDSSPHPTPGAGTHFLDHAAALAGYSDPAWYEANIPFVDLPDATMQSVYYYRWRVYKEHLRYTNPTDGWISTEFLDCCGYAAPYQAIDAAAGHQLTEGRWLRDPGYGQDYLKFWLTGPGAGPKPATDDVNADTTDWAHEYSVWLATSAYGQAQVTGDFAPLRQLLPALVRQYRGWDKQFNPGLGLYWSVPVWDAMEFSASSYESAEPYHGGAGYRPTLNSYQYGDAVAISRIADSVGDHRLAAEYAQRATRVQAAMQKWLWDPERGFYYAMARDDNPGHRLSGSREQIGYLPWTFGAAGPADTTAWSQLLDPQGFASTYGPTTAERRSPFFMKDAGSCCRWDGPSWPFATSQTLTGLANLLDDHPAQRTVSKEDYAAALATYARTQTRNGEPYVAEAHDPDRDAWIYDGQNHSEDYNHSTYTDLVLSGLLGLRPQSGDTLEVKPLTPAGWDHFAAENVPYHGHNVSVLWDRDGKHYGQGAGMRLYVDGKLVQRSATLRDTTIDVGRTVVPQRDDLVNDAANPLRTGYPRPITSYTWPNDNAWNALDGKVFYSEVPENTRWTNYGSPNPGDFYGVDFGAPTPVGDIRWSGYDDGGGVRPAAAYSLQYWTGAAWQDVPRQVRAPHEPGGQRRQPRHLPHAHHEQGPAGVHQPAGRVRRRHGAAVLDAVEPGRADRRRARQRQRRSHRRPEHPADRDGAQHDVEPAGLAAGEPRRGRGWAVTPTGRPAAAIPPGQSRTSTFTLAAPPDAEPGSAATLTATASYRGPGGRAETTHQRQNLQIPHPAGQHDAVGAWGLDEGSGTVAHDSAGIHDAALTGAPGWVPGVTGTALQLDGSSQYAQTGGPVLDTTGNYSVSAWVRLDRTGSWATAVSQDGDPSSGFYLQYSAADDRLAFSTSAGRALADVAPQPGRWYRLVGVHDADAGTYVLYVDGVAQAKTWSQATGDASPGPLAIGRAVSGGQHSDLWPGSVDDVEVWNRVLTAADVTGGANLRRPAPAGP